MKVPTENFFITNIFFRSKSSTESCNFRNDLKTYKKAFELMSSLITLKPRFFVGNTFCVSSPLHKLVSLRALSTSRVVTDEEKKQKMKLKTVRKLILQRVNTASFFLFWFLRCEVDNEKHVLRSFHIQVLFQ